MTFTGLLTIAAILVALAAFSRARRAARRLDRLSESYWELRYELGQVKARLARLESATGLREAEDQPQHSPATTAFVPLSSLKK